MRWAFVCLSLTLLSAPFSFAVEQFTVEVLERKPQPRDYFVQGLEIAGDKLYVSTGLYGASRLLQLDLASGKPLIQHRLGRHLFGEGLTLLGDTLYQLTWRKGLLLRYDPANFEEKSAWPLPGEGWGITNNGEHLIYSDGSDQLRFLSVDDGRVLKSLRVTRNGVSIKLLNELEWIDRSIWANVWGTDSIVIIDPDSGHVTGNIDLRGLLPLSERRRGTDVLNGIARDSASGDIWVTGKRWPWRYKIRLVPAKSATH